MKQKIITLAITAAFATVAANATTNIDNEPKIINVEKVSEMTEDAKNAAKMALENDMKDMPKSVQEEAKKELNKIK